MLRRRKTVAVQPPRLQVPCPNCIGMIVVEEGSVGFFVELICPSCGAQSYHDLERSRPG